MRRSTCRDVSRRGTLVCSPWSTLIRIMVISFLFVLSVGFALAISPEKVEAQSSNPAADIWVTNGYVKDILALGDTTYLAGDFSVVGPNTGKGVPLDATTGEPAGDFPKVNEIVATVVPDGSGGWFIGGYFTRVGNSGRERLAHIKADGSLDADWDPGANGAVLCMAFSGTTLYVGGEFSTAGGQSRSRIAAIDCDPLSPNYGDALSWNPSATGGYVYALAISGTTVYAGGGFTMIGGPPRNFIAALDATTGAATSWEPNAGSVVWSLAVSGSTIYAGGAFSTIGGETRNRIAALDATSGLATSWDPNASSDVKTLAIDGTTVYAGGNFTTIGGQSRNRIAALSASTGLATDWNPGSGSEVDALAVSGGNVFAGGWFTTMGGQARYYVASIDAAAGTLNAWNPVAGSYVYAIAVSGSTVYVGGNFSTIGGVARKYAAALDTDPTSLSFGEATAWNPGPNVYVNALAASGSTIYLGGNFSTVGVESRIRLAAVDATTGAVDSWNPGANLEVYTLDVEGTTIYVGGEFHTCGGDTRNHIAAIDTGGSLTAWNPNSDGPVRAVDSAGAVVYVGGFFSTIGGESRGCIAAIDAVSGSATGWNPDSDYGLYTIKAVGDTVYAGGQMTFIGGATRIGLAALDAASGSATAWNPGVNNDVFSLDVANGVVYAGGWFTTAGGQTRHQAAGLDATSGLATAWNPDLNGTPRTLTVAGSVTYIGGEFNTVGTELCTYVAGFLEAPTLDSITPNSGHENETVNITDLAGTNFVATPVVQLQKLGESSIDASAVAVVSPTQITCAFDLTGAATGDWDVYLENPDGQSDTLTGAFTVESSTAPYITSIVPDSGTRGETVSGVVLSGGNFVDGAEVSLMQGLDVIAATNVLVGSSTEITCDLPLPLGAATGAWDVYVENPDTQSDTLVGGFVVNDPTPPAPALSGITPGSGPAGNEVTLMGTDFGATRGSSYVRFGSIQATSYTAWGDTQVKCLVPSGASGTVQVKLTTTAGTSNGKNFTVTSPSPATTFYFAEGYTGEGFQEYLCIGNSNPGAVTVGVCYGTSGFPPDSAAVNYTVPGNSRLTIDVNQASGIVGDVTIKVISASGGLCAERPMYFDNGGITGGHDTVGATAPSTTWYFAEGYTGAGFSEYLRIVNCAATEAHVDLKFQTQESGEIVRPVVIPASSRYNVSVNEVLGPGYQTSCAIVSDQPLVAERTVYFDYMGWGNWHWTGGHCVMGANALSNQYYFAEGTTRSGFEEWLTLQNPNAGPISVTATYQLGYGQGDPVTKSYPIDGGRRLTLYVPFEAGAEKDVSVRLSSASTFLAERPMYFAYTWQGVNWNGGHCVIGASAPAADWFFAEGYTGPGFQEWICLQNPGDTDASVQVSYYVQDQGALPVRTVTVPARTRVTLFVNDHAGSGLALSARIWVTSGPGIICERPMYFSYAGVWDGGHDVVGYAP